MTDNNSVSAPDLEEVDRPVRCIVDNVAELAEQNTVSLAEVTDAFGSDCFVPVMLVPALLVVSPLSGIPGFATVCGLAIAFVAVQMLMQSESLWLPGWLMRRELDGDKAERVMIRLRSIADWLDDHSKERLQLLMKPAGRSTIQLLCLICGCAMPLLELVPFSSSILGLAVVLFSTSLLMRDGVFALFGFAALGTALALPLTLLSAV
ncbi:hypothetical protein CLV78_10779 [Aliiruegeria haliotis]|uniref:Exopolysaccharide synthesis protein ExoD n=1 Tax=Aliiruegeria haliotis TaxID=1280846 RepID=A0A2T0RLT5_9RHOB|nr:exopolysaccharide biosynthesis protein [Aliiruegeria haliotis]PRY22155.1 hypothetical protein CLV78_10779 [Aliiruegeria haliotis]